MTAFDDLRGDPDRLRRRTVQSGAATLVARGLQALIFLGAAVALARLLTPEDFGVFAMVLPLGAIAANVTNRSVQTALLQSRDPSAEGVDGFFRFVVRANLLIAAALAGSGVVLARFYSEPRVVGIAVAWAAVLLVLVPATFQEALLKRALRFPAVMAVQLGTLTLGVVASLFAAAGGWGYRALPLQVFVMEVGRAIGIFLLSDWRPGGSSGAATAGAHDTAGEVAGLRRAWLHLVGLRVSTWLTDLPAVVAVGRLGGAGVLGNYDTARRWAGYPFEEPFHSLTDVTLASLRHVRDEPARFRRLSTSAFLVMLTISLPAMAFVAVEADAVVRVVFGPRWLGAIWFLRVLCAAAFATAIVRVNRWIYLGEGRTGRLLRWSLLFEAPLLALAALVGAFRGAEGVAVAVAAAAWALVVPSVLFAVHGSSLTATDVARSVFRPALASIAAAAAVASAAGLLPSDPGPARLIVAAALHGLAFVAAWHVIPGGLADTRALWAAVRELRPTGARLAERGPGPSGP